MNKLNSLTSVVSILHMMIAITLCSSTAAQNSPSEKGRLDAIDVEMKVKDFGKRMPEPKLTVDEILTEIGTPSQYFRADRNQTFLFQSLKKGEMVILYGNYFTDFPTDDHALAFYINEDRVARALYHFKPKEKHMFAIEIDFKKEIATVLQGSYDIKVNQ